jgi:hypothetical protein
METTNDYIKAQLDIAIARKMNCETQSKAWYFYDGMITAYNAILAREI